MLKGKEERGQVPKIGILAQKTGSGQFDKGFIAEAMNVCLKARNSCPTTRKPRAAGAPASESLDADTASGPVFQTEPENSCFRALFVL
jgi:hypothetical protein